MDTFVSSKPQVAALIWGGIKMTILLASRVATYFDQVTYLIMNIGKVCPLYQQFGHLYPDCIGLQESLCDYYAIVLRMCAKIIQISRQSQTIAAQMLNSILNPFEAEFKPFQRELERSNDTIRLQLSLASKRAIQEEAKLASLERKESAFYRQKTLDFYKDTMNEQDKAQKWRRRQAERAMTKMRSTIRTNLYEAISNPVKVWKQAMKDRAPNTANWVEQDAEFCKWRTCTGTALLWCSGTMGTGKTVLISNIIAFLSRRDSRNKTCYFYCRSEQRETLQARNILGSLAYQALESFIAQASEDALDDLLSKSRELDAEDVSDFLIPYLHRSKRYYFIIDGIDECDIQDIRVLAREIAKLRRRSQNLSIICAGRPELEVELFRNHWPDFRISLTGEKTRLDISHYISYTLDQFLDRGELQIRDPSIIWRIIAELESKSCGM